MDQTPHTKLEARSTLTPLAAAWKLGCDRKEDQENENEHISCALVREMNSPSTTSKTTAKRKQIHGENEEDGTILRAKRLSYSKVDEPSTFFDRPVRLVLRRSFSSPPDLIHHHPDHLVLPVLSNTKHPDLNVIDPSTVENLLNGEYEDKLDSFHLIDCRFDYEYDGGHIKTARSGNSPEIIENLFFSNIQRESTQRVALIFYCEFSSYRAPRM